MPAAAILPAVGIGLSLVSADKQRSAANQAVDAQKAAAQSAQAQQQMAFDTVQNNLSPYRALGQQGIQGVQGLLGLSGPQAQQAAYGAIQNSPAYQSMVSEGENALRQNAAATGGLRGGNFQAALERYRPQLLQQLVDQQYSRLGGLLNAGQNSAAGIGQAALQTGNSIAGLSNDIGAYNAGGALAGGRANAGLLNGLGNIAGQIGASPGGFGGAFGGFGNLFGGTGMSTSNAGGYVGAPAGFGFGGLGGGGLPTSGGR